MAILSKGTDFTTGDQVTAANLDALVDNATFASGAVDDTSTALDSSSPQKIIVKDGGITTVKVADDAITTAKMPNSSSKTTGVTFAKMKHISTAKILGRASAGEGDIEEAFDFKDEDDMSSNSATALASQQSIKAYVDLLRPKYIALTGGTTGLTQSSEATYQYNIADFTGSGLTAANIYQIHILCNLQMNYDAGGSNSRVQASYPNAIDTLVTIFQTNRDSGGDSTQNFSSLVTVPINASQSYVKVGLEFVTAGSFQIVGATVFK